MKEGDAAVVDSMTMEGHVSMVIFKHEIYNKDGLWRLFPKRSIDCGTGRKKRNSPSWA